MCNSPASPRDRYHLVHYRKHHSPRRCCGSPRRDDSPRRRDDSPRRRPAQPRYNSFPSNCSYPRQASPDRYSVRGPFPVCLGTRLSRNRYSL